MFEHKDSPARSTYIRRCIPLLQCLQVANYWWTPNLSTLIGKDLREGLFLQRRMILDGNEFVLVMEKQLSLRSRGTSTESYAFGSPVQLNKDFHQLFKTKNGSGRPRWIKRAWRSWAIHVGLSAIQQALSRRSLE
jgi:hypothetical protein